MLRMDDSRLPVVRATLCAPWVRNRLDAAAVEALGAALDRAERTGGATVFVLDAEGPAFCAGLSLGGADRSDWRARVGVVRDLLARLSASPLITVAVVDGHAIGGGVGLAAACDQVVLGPRGSFRLTEVLLGLVPAVALPVVARRTGRQRAFSLALTAREVAGEDAVRIGLADDHAPDAEHALRNLLRRLRGADDAALRALKRYRERWEAPRPDLAALIEETLDERLADRGVAERLVRFEGHGMLP
jgi:polyketide biosynthesis enoyl-CoA hydratase PksH